MPEAPARPKVTRVESEEAALLVSWIAPADGGAPIASYALDMKRAEETRWRRVAADIACTEFTCAGLEFGADYQFRVAAQNQAGVGAFSDVSATQRCGVLFCLLIILYSKYDLVYAVLEQYQCTLDFCNYCTVRYSNSSRVFSHTELVAEIARPLQEVHVHSLAEQAVFECELSRPLPASAVQWRFYPLASATAPASASRGRAQPPARVLKSDDRYSIEQDASGRVARLVLPHVELDAQGTYECCAANVTTRAALSVDSMRTTLLYCSVL